MTRFAAAKSLATGAAMAPVTTSKAVGNVLSYFKRMGELNLPGPDRAIKSLADTPLGKIQLTVTDMGGISDLADRIGTIVHRKDMLTVNPQILKQIYAAGDKIKGIGSVSFEWPEAIGSKAMAAPTESIGTGTSRQILRAVQDVYQNKVIPTLQQLNPGSALMLFNEPTSLSRAKLYQRARMMGPLDPMGSQHSLILPSGTHKPIEIFGGGIPTWLMDR